MEHVESHAKQIKTYKENKNTNKRKLRVRIKKNMQLRIKNPKYVILNEIKNIDHMHN